MRPAARRVLRSGDVSSAASATWSTVDGTATAASGDFVGATGTVSFAAGETEKKVTIAVLDDARVEPLPENEGRWLPADCGGPPCTYDSFPSVEQPSADRSNAGTTPARTSAYRLSGVDDNDKTDWTQGASSFRRREPLSGNPAVLNGPGH